MNADVVVVGSFVQDLTFRCAALPQPGETTLGEFHSGPGGKGSNQAVAAARAGARVRFIGAVGRDAFAVGALRFHRAEGIESRLVAKPPHPTASAGIIVDASGRNQIVVAIGASARLAPRDVPSRWLRSARVVVCQHEANLTTNAHVFRSARRVGATTLLNPAPMRADFELSMLRHVDVLIPNENEFIVLVNRFRELGAASAAGQDLVRLSSRSLTESGLRELTPDELQQLCRLFNVPVVIVTLGERGCFVSLTDRCEHLPAYAVEVTDSTGAGDAFVGAFAAGLVKFAGDVLNAARFANAAAALSVTRFGTASSMPTATEIRKLMAPQQQRRTRRSS